MLAKECFKKVLFYFHLFEYLAWYNTHAVVIAKVISLLFVLELDSQYILPANGSTNLMVTNNANTDKVSVKLCLQFRGKPQLLQWKFNFASPFFNHVVYSDIFGPTSYFIKCVWKMYKTTGVRNERRRIFCLEKCSKMCNPVDI